MSDSGPIITNFETAWNRLLKRVNRLESRPVTMPTANLLGPGLVAQAVQIMDWSSRDATTNGFYYTGVGGINVPDDTLSWTGQVIAKDDGTGMQQVWSADTEEPQQWTRTYAPDGDLLVFTEWKRFLTPSGLIGTDELAPEVITDIEAGGSIPDPATSPTPVAEAGPGSVIISYPPPADSRWIIDLHYTTDDTDTVGPATLHTEGIKQLSFVYRDPAGAILDPEGEHFFALVARNPDGAPAPASAWVPGTVGQVDPEHLRLLVGELIAERLVGKEIEGVTIKGSRFESGNAYWDETNGLVFPQPDGTEIHLPVDGTAATMAVALSITKELMVNAGGNVQGILKMLGSLLLTNAIPNPTGYQSITPDWPITSTLSGADSSLWRGLCDTPDGLNWVNVRRAGTIDGTAYAPILQRFLKSTGVQQDWESMSGDSQVFGVTRIGSNLFVLATQVGGDNQEFLYIHKHSATTLDRLETFMLLNSSAQQIELPATAKDPTIGYNTSANRLVVGIPYSAANNYMYEFNSTNGALIDADIMATQPSHEHMGFVGIGTWNVGIDRQMIGFRSNLGFKAFNTTTWVEDSAMAIPAAGGAQIRGAWFDGQRFWSMNSTGTIREYSTYRSARTVKGQQAWASDDGAGGFDYVTLPGTMSSNVVIPAGAWIKMTSPPPPEASGVLAASANAVVQYLSLSAASPIKQGVVLTGGQWSQLIEDIAVAPGTAPSGTNTFPTTLGELEAQAGGFRVDGQSDGSVGTGTFRQSVRAAAHEAARFSKSSTQSITNAAAHNTQVTFGNLDADLDELSVTVATNNEFTIPAGYYEISVHLAYASSATGRRGMLLTRNNATAPASTDTFVIGGDSRAASGTGITTVETTIRRRWTSATTLRVWAAQNSGAALDIVTDQGGCELTITRLGD